MLGQGVVSSEIAVFSRLLYNNNNNNNTFLNRVHCCFQDTRFNHDIDARTGYKTHSLLCMPIKDFNGEVMGVAQVSFERHSSLFHYIAWY